MLRLTRIFTLLACMLTTGLALGATADLNSADAKSLEENLDGIGLSKARAIVAYRDQHGRFSSPEQLLQVKGVGKKTLDRNRERITLEGGTASNQ